MLAYQLRLLFAEHKHSISPVVLYENQSGIYEGLVPGTASANEYSYIRLVCAFTVTGSNKYFVHTIDTTLNSAMLIASDFTSNGVMQVATKNATLGSNGITLSSGVFCNVGTSQAGIKSQFSTANSGIKVIRVEGIDI